MYRKAVTARKLAAITGWALALSLISGCPRPVRAPEPAAPGPAPAADTRGAALYAIDPQQSQVLIHVYRGGTLARLGHNHVIAAKEVSGRAWLHPTFARSGFELAFPVAQLIVDDEGMRRAAGAEFSTQAPEADKAGTRKNMLRAEVLDAERYSQITLRSMRVAGSPAAATLSTRITIREAARDVEIPAVIQVDGDRLRASGEFDVLQSDFGIKPFSVALGALEVQDRLHIKFAVVAVKSQKAE